MPLVCPSCRERLTPAEIVEGSLSSVPGKGLVDFACVLCGETGLARLSDGLAETGHPAGRGFEVFSFEVVPDLAVAPRRTSLAVWHRGKQKEVPEARAPRPSRPPAS